jgi:hypothetical protein
MKQEVDERDCDVSVFVILREMREREREIIPSSVGLKKLSTAGQAGII